MNNEKKDLIFVYFDVYYKIIERKHKLASMTFTDIYWGTFIFGEEIDGKVCNLSSLVKETLSRVLSQFCLKLIQR